MDISTIKSNLRRIDPSAYPELKGHSRDTIYEGRMGPGGLYLAARMSRSLGVRGGGLVMDLGCGKGATSAFLVQHLGVRVVAVDLWIPANELHQRFVRLGVADRVIPLNLDITQRLPFADGYFDAIFCMDSMHYYGGNVESMRHLLKHLKPGGRFCIGSPCFNREFTEEELASLPHESSGEVWASEFSKYHSPHWWRALLEETGLVRTVECAELEDGVVLWEAELLYHIESCGWSAERAQSDFAQMAYGHDNEPYLTHFVLTVQKMTGSRPPMLHPRQHSASRFWLDTQASRRTMILSSKEARMKAYRISHTVRSCLPGHGVCTWNA
jgi:SAM-dependent methyltransferase